MNRAVPDDIIQEVRERSNIVEVMGFFGVQLKKSGGDTWKARCPFHHEKTPSFTVNETRQRYKCFGCGKGGDVFRFVMDQQSVDFPNAIHLLADRCGVIIPEKNYATPEEHAAARTRRNKRDRLFELMETFTEYYSQWLWTNLDSPLGQYFRSRRIPREVAQKFRIGAVPDGWDNSLNFGLHKKFTEEEMLDAGILKVNEETKKIYDRFRNRLLFAIWNEQGKVVGFSGRAIEPDQTPKYLNSPDTPIFHKGSILYALPLARQQIREKQFAILCEGQIDTISMHCAGFANTVATQGTAFGEEHARLLKRYTDKVLLAMDSDAAGQSAILKAVKILLPLEFEVGVILWPGGKDPDELYQHEGAGVIAAQVQNAMDFFDFLWNRLSAEYDLAQPFGRQKAAENAVDYIRLIPAPVARELYIRKLAELVKVSESVILRLLARQSPPGGGYRQQSAPAPAPESVILAEELDDCPPEQAHAEETLLEMALADEPFARGLREKIPPAMLSSTLVGQALNTVIDLAANGNWAHRIDILSDMEDERDQEDPRLSRLLVQNLTIPRDKLDKALSDTLSVLQRHHKEKRLRAIREQMSRQIDREERERLLKEYMNLHHAG